LPIADFLSPAERLTNWQLAIANRQCLASAVDFFAEMLINLTFPKTEKFLPVLERR